MRPPTEAAGSGAPSPVLRSMAVSAATGLAVFAFLFLPDLLAHRAFVYRDVANYHLPVSRVVTGEWSAGRVPHWNPWIAGGTPLAANPNNYALYPGRALDVALGPDTGMQVHLLGHWWAGGVAVGALVALLGASAVAAAAAALAWYLAGPVLSLLSFANLAPFLLWIPLTAIAAVALLRRPGPGPAAALAVALAAQTTFAEPGLLLVEALFLAAVIALDPLRPPRAGPRRVPLGWSALALLLAGLFSLPVWVPTLRLVAASARGADLGADVATSVPPAALVQLAVPQLTGAYHTLTKSGFWGEVFTGGTGPFFLSISLGTAALALAGAGLAGLGRRGLGIAGAAALGILLAMGVHAPGLDALFFSEAGRWFRWPVKMMMLPALALPFAVAAGVDGLRAGRRRAAWAAAGFGLVAAGAVLAYPRWFAASELPAQLATVGKDLPRIGEELGRACARSGGAGLAVAALAVATLRLSGRARGVVVGVAVLVLAGEMLGPQRAVNRGVPVDTLTASSPILAEARAIATTGRRVYFPTAHWEVALRLVPGAADEWTPRLQLDRELGNFYLGVGERVPSVLVNPDRLVSRAAAARGAVRERLTPADQRTLLRRLAVGGVVRTGLDALASGARVHPTAAGWPVSLDTDPGAPAMVGWLAEPPPVVERWTAVALRELARSPSPAPVSRAGFPAPGRREIETAEARPGWIVLAESGGPGWAARLDGAPVPILRYLDDLQAVAVPAGRHEVIFTYRPPGWRLLLLGAALGLVGVTALAAAAGRAARRFPVSSPAPDHLTRENP